MPKFKGQKTFSFCHLDFELHLSFEFYHLNFSLTSRFLRRVFQYNSHLGRSARMQRLSVILLAAFVSLLLTACAPSKHRPIDVYLTVESDHGDPDLWQMQYELTVEILPEGSRSMELSPEGEDGYYDDGETVTTRYRAVLPERIPKRT